MIETWNYFKKQSPNRFQKLESHFKNVGGGFEGATQTVIKSIVSKDEMLSKDMTDMNLKRGLLAHLNLISEQINFKNTWKVNHLSSLIIQPYS